MDDSYNLSLTLNESTYLSDCLSCFTKAPDHEGNPSQGVYPELLLKVGSAFMELVEERVPVSQIRVTITELWVLREMAKSGVKLGSESVGIALMKKVYAGLLTLSAGSESHAAVVRFGETTDEEPERSTYTSQLQEIRNGSHDGGPANDTGHDNPNANDPNCTHDLS